MRPTLTIDRLFVRESGRRGTTRIQPDFLKADTPDDRFQAESTAGRPRRLDHGPRRTYHAWGERIRNGRWGRSESVDEFC